jgi:hypothetical protein
MDASTDGDEKATCGYNKQRFTWRLRQKEEEKENGTCEGTGDLRCDELWESTITHSKVCGDWESNPGCHGHNVKY